MPSIITHHIFGEKVLERSAYAQTFREPERDAFTWGCQGPDPFFFAFRTRHSRSIHKLGSLMHTTETEVLLAAMRTYIKGLSSLERSVAEAYVFGFLCHYTLDSMAHPYVYYLEEEEMKDRRISDGGYVHALIEASLDMAALETFDGRHLADFQVNHILPSNREIMAIFGRLYQNVLEDTYGIVLPVPSYVRAFIDMRTIEQILYSKNGTRREKLSRIERLVRRHSMAEALAHIDEGTANFQYANLSRNQWRNPFTGVTESTSFLDLFVDATARAGENINHFIDGDPTESITRGYDFHGARTIDEYEEVTEHIGHIGEQIAQGAAVV